MKRELAIGIAALVSGCAPGQGELPTTMDAIQRLETRSGGRLGVVLLDSRGKPLIAYRADERFAFCSSFKVALAGALLDAAEEGLVDLTAPVAYSEADLPGYQPVMGPKLVDGRGKRHSTKRLTPQSPPATIWPPTSSSMRSAGRIGSRGTGDYGGTMCLASIGVRLG